MKPYTLVHTLQLVSCQEATHQHSWLVQTNKCRGRHLCDAPGVAGGGGGKGRLLHDDDGLKPRSSHAAKCYLQQSHEAGDCLTSVFSTQVWGLHSYK